MKQALLIMHDAVEKVHKLGFDIVDVTTFSQDADAYLEFYQCLPVMLGSRPSQRDRVYLVGNLTDEQEKLVEKRMNSGAE